MVTPVAAMAVGELAGTQPGLGVGDENRQGENQRDRHQHSSDRGEERKRPLPPFMNLTIMTKMRHPSAKVLSLEDHLSGLAK